MSDLEAVSTRGHHMVPAWIMLMWLPMGMPEPSELWGSAEVHASFLDTRLSELSGLAFSRTNPDYLWTHNDSGDASVLYLVDREGGLRSVAHLQDTFLYDMEDIASGPCGPSDPSPCLYLGDFGDNRHKRPHVHIHRVREPRLSGSPPSKMTLPVEQTWHFTYPEGAFDAEGLMVHPETGAMYVLQKARRGVAGVFEISRGEEGSRQAPAHARRVRDMPLKAPTRAGRLYTAADVSPDGRCVAFRTYLEIHTRCLEPGAQDFERVFDRPADISRAMALFQSEAVTFDPKSSGLYTTSERWPAPLVYLPRRSPQKATPEE